MANYVNIKPDILRWAIDRSRLPVGDYPDNIADWLSGERRPTYNQLEAFARRAMVPLGYLFLEQPPDEQLPLPDYRTRVGERVRKPSPNLVETIFDMQARQDWMREYLTEEGHQSLPFVGSAAIGDSVEPIARRIRQTLAIDDGWAEQQPSWEAALRHLRERIEEAGILIFISGVVGNNTSRKLDPEEFQGFVLIDSIAPLIFVNGADFKVAQMFTIAHELAHVWVGESALFDLVALTPADVKVERFCDAVAAEFLVPAEKLLSEWPGETHGDATFISLGRRFKVSPIVVARRAKDLRLISSEAFFGFYHRYMRQERSKEQGRRGGNFWLTQNARLGRRFGRAVVAAAQEGRLSYPDAYELTGLYGETFDKFIQILQQGAGQ